MTYRINDNGVDRDATPAEIVEIKQKEKEDAEKRALEIAALEAAAAAKASARVKLAALGLTDAEIAAFLGA